MWPHTQQHEQIDGTEQTNKHWYIVSALYEHRTDLLGSTHGTLEKPQPQPQQELVFLIF